jgi:hypothetical protein
MIGQSAACGLHRRRNRRNQERSWRRRGFFFAAIRFQFLQSQLQLLDLSLKLLRLPTKLHAVQFDQKQLQMFDLTLAREQLLVLRQNQCAQRFCGKHVQIGECVHRHARSIA